MAGHLAKAYVDLEAIQRNTTGLNALTHDKCLFMAVVKADAYGHGAVPVAKAALAAGASWLGVARLEEAIPLRTAGITCPILVFGYIHPEDIKTVADLDLTMTVYDLDTARAASEKAASFAKPVDVHLKVDTGMGRVGMIIDKDVADKDARTAQVRDIQKIVSLPGIAVKGIYTHFAAADSRDKSYTDFQIQVFDSILEDLKKQGIEFEIRHASNSAGIIEFKAAHYDMVRAGISLYGLYPSNEVNKATVELIPAMTLTSVITGVRDVPKGFCVSYGMTHKTKSSTRLASVPMGYADGFLRAFSSNGHMLVKGQRAPIVGRVCMDQTMIDVGHINGVALGDDVVVFGRQENEVLSADELAKNVDTINYEIVAALTSRVERVYLNI